MAIDWNAIYAEELARIDDPTEDIKALKQNDINSLDSQKTAGEEKLRGALEEALQQAYITREMNKRDLPSIMANLGLTGGVTETAAGDLLRDYRNSKNAANKNYNTGLTDVTNTYNTNLASINSTYGTQLANALAQRERDANANANTRYQNELAAEQWAWQQAQAVAAAAAAAANTGGTSGGTGGTGDQITGTSTNNNPMGHGDRLNTGYDYNSFYDWQKQQQDAQTAQNKFGYTPSFAGGGEMRGGVGGSVNLVTGEQKTWKY